VIVLDASCLVSLLRGEPGQNEVAGALAGDCGMSVLNRAEVIDRLARHGAVADDVAADLDTLGIAFQPLTVELADQAATLRSRHYHRVERPLSLADCVALATAIATRSALATSDVHLAVTCTNVECEVVEVANSMGQYPLHNP
jgi:PIN domain nuclease of toxin-antitoxin system